MIPLTASTVAASDAKPKGNLWLSALYAGVATALLTLLFVLFFRMENLVLYTIMALLIGVGPVLGYSVASGRLGSIILPLIGGIIGSIFLLLFIVIGVVWPLLIASQGSVVGGVGGLIVLAIFSLIWGLLVGVLDSSQSVGKLIVGSIIAAFLGAIVFLLVANSMGQDPSWLGTGVILMMAVWGGSAGAAMEAWAKSS
ncbi:hypothetical protein KFU94_10820 [Chloroflexi bacterium TSY]|nr:hypothetical protein [Chloroflexi bacterium TSY]